MNVLFLRVEKKRGGTSDVRKAGRGRCRGEIPFSHFLGLKPLSFGKKKIGTGVKRQHSTSLEKILSLSMTKPAKGEEGPEGMEGRRLNVIAGIRQEQKYTTIDG